MKELRLIKEYNHAIMSLNNIKEGCGMGIASMRIRNLVVNKYN